MTYLSDRIQITTSIIRISWLYLLCLLPFYSSAQNDTFNTGSPVYIADLSADRNFICFADRENVYILKSNDLSLIRKIPYDYSSKGFVSYLAFHPYNPDLLLVKYSRFNDEVVVTPLNAYPNDSTFGFNISNGNTVFSYPGNALVAFSASNQNIVVWNNYFRYESQGRTMHYQKPGYFIFNDTKHLVESVITDIAISPDDSLVAISYIDSLYNGIYYSTLEIRKYSSFDQIINKRNFQGVMLGLKFSDDVESLYFYNQEGNVFIVSSDSLDTPENYNIKNLNPWIINNVMISLSDFNIKAIDLNTSEEAWKIWANLTPLWSIKGALYLNESEIIVYGIREGIDEDEQKGGVYIVDLVDDEIYVENKQVDKQESLFELNNLSVKQITGSLTGLYYHRIKNCLQAMEWTRVKETILSYGRFLTEENYMIGISIKIFIM